MYVLVFYHLHVTAHCRLTNHHLTQVHLIEDGGLACVVKSNLRKTHKPQGTRGGWEGGWVGGCGEVVVFGCVLCVWWLGDSGVGEGGSRFPA